MTLLMVGASLLYADTNMTTPEQELDQAYETAGKQLVVGPKDIPILQQATLKLPENFGFVPKQESIALLDAMGNGVDNQIEGIILPLGEWEEGGFFVVSYIDSGYIRDDDAKDWNADELLASLKEGTEAMNQERILRGIPEIEVMGWITPPWYDQQTHELIWSAELKNKVESVEDLHGINYNTYVLGREGYISLNLVTDTAYIEALKPIAKNLLTAMRFDEGKRYADFNADTDRVAEYGLAALVAGVAAKKLGLFAIIAAFVVKFAKFIGLGLIGVWLAFKGLFRRKD